MDKYIGKKIDGRYEILELIATGGMSYIYKGRDTVEERVVAIKILKDEYIDNEEFLVRFRNESKAVAMLSHHNIVKIFDVSLGRIQAIVMEYIEGITLKEYIEKKGKLPYKEAIYFTVQTLKALDHAHSQGIVHRDIKPQNIMLLPDGSIKVMDFGIARFARAEMKTVTDKAIGSVHYISPEQAKGEGAEAGSDIYSIGVMLFEMLTGQLPFNAETPVSVAILQISQTPKKPRELDPSIPEGLEAITLRALEKDPTKRYANVSQLLADIDKFKKDPSIQFEYKYFNNEDLEGTKYVDVIKEVKKETKVVAEEIEEEEVEDTKKPFPILTILSAVAGACLLVAGIFVFGVLSDAFSDNPDITLSDLRGMTIEEVGRLEGYQNINFEITGEGESEDYPPGTIIEHYPSDGRVVKAGSTVQVKISVGVSTINVPDIVGETEGSAISILSELGIASRIEYQSSSDVDQGDVIRTYPDVGTTISYNEEVVVYVSSGTENNTVTVPDIRGMTQNDAAMFLTRNRLRSGDVTTVDSDMPIGTVITQSVDPNSKVPQNTVIDYTVSSGSFNNTMSVLVEMPNNPFEPTANLKAFVDGIIVSEANVLIESLPAQGGLRYWEVSITGQGQGTLVILYNDNDYMHYSINFEAGAVTKTLDYRLGYEKPVEEDSSSSTPTPDPDPDPDPDSDSSSSSESTP